VIEDEDDLDKYIKQCIDREQGGTPQDGDQEMQDEQQLIQE